MVPPYSDKVSRAPPYSSSLITPLRVRDYHPLWSNFPDRSTKMLYASWAAPLSLAATQGISVDFFSSGYLDVSVLRVCFAYPMYSGRDDTLWCRVSPFGNPRVNACLSAHRGLSQITTSFIASYRLGIHHIRLVT